MKKFPERENAVGPLGGAGSGREEGTARRSPGKTQIGGHAGNGKKGRAGTGDRRGGGFRRGERRPRAGQGELLQDFDGDVAVGGFFGDGFDGFVGGFPASAGDGRGLHGLAAPAAEGGVAAGFFFPAVVEAALGLLAVDDDLDGNKPPAPCTICWLVGRRAVFQ